MSRSTRVHAASIETPTTVRSRFVRAGVGLAVLTALTAFAVRANAQSAPARPFEVRPFVGAFVPTGDHRDLLKDAVIAGAQASYSFTPHFAAVGSFGWSPSKDQTTVGEPKVDLYQYDLGIEGQLSDLTPTASLETRPYATLGVGGRTYSYRDVPGTGSQTNFLGYGAIGLDVAQQNGPFGVRFEARDNVSAFKGLRGELADRKTRNDLQFTAGLTVGF